MQVNHIIIGTIAVITITVIGYFITKNKTRQRKAIVKLVQKKEVSHDSYIYTYLLPHNIKSLGLRIGEHVELIIKQDGKQIRRKYTPISRIDKSQTFELLIKTYRKCQKFPNGGIMSQYLQNMNVNDTINICFPFGKINYQGNCLFAFKRPNNSIMRRKYKHIYMVAGGTGITPLFQIIQYVCQNEKEENRPKLTLLFANRTQKDILLKKQLESYLKLNQNFSCYFSVDVSQDKQWNGMTGFVDQEKIRKTLPNQQITNILLLTCGPPILCNLVDKYLINLNIPIDQIYRF